jgi:phosphoglycerol transferase MdoB-like AlkP superfamily enzyme
MVKMYMPVVLFVLLLICIIDFYFFRFFQTHISVLIFGIVQDDTIAVAKFLYGNYPVFYIIAGAATSYIIFRKVIVSRFILNTAITRAPASPYLKSSAAILVFSGAFLGIRGTLPTPDSFPLLVDDASVSTNIFINSIPLNPIFAFKQAISDLQEETVERDMDKIVANSGFTSVAAAYSFFKGRHTGNITPDSLFNTTAPADTPALHMPNVVVVQMESMSCHLLDFHNHKTLNLLGALADELPGCYVFKNALPCQDGTNHSLEGLLLNTPRASVSQSVLMTHPFSGANALPFQHAGYNTFFITGAKTGWRNINQFVPPQGFNTLEGDIAVARHVPGTTFNEWGAYDEFMFERMWQVLNNSTRPTFIFGMTTTNHPRYFLPDTYHPLPIQLNPVLRQRRIKDSATLIENLKTYQYANNCLGNFIKKVKASPAGSNTIIIATGDHNIHDLINYSGAELLQANSVPIIMYIPDALKPAQPVNTKRFVSHKDIFTSIIPLALQEAKYFALGNNIFDTNTKSKGFDFAIYCGNIAYNNAGVCMLKEKTFYKWADNNRQLLIPAKQPISKELDSLAKMAKAYMLLSNYYLAEEYKRSRK